MDKVYEESTYVTDEMYQYIMSRLTPINKPNIIVMWTPMKSNWVREYFLRSSK